ncbi:class E sortase [Streptomyces sp. GC420]|uniref:class E sortase n=1 Tax=Streptomyces sp. GC420 TaxID=2697568 RepID=UPI001414FFB0|nr:class E sortase [Streptomyces sp. GC420]NBM18452.1 sortase [Streptomyces sp. GC420]
MSPRRTAVTALTGGLLAVLVALAGCAASGDSGGAVGGAASDARAALVPSPSRAVIDPVAGSVSDASPTPTPDATRARSEPASLSIPAIGVKDLRVVPYEGTTDDRPGTRIQDTGVAASPYGEKGGVGPGETGNYLVTAHRLSAGGPLRDLPLLDAGDTVTVTAGDTVYTYRITETRKTSFRSERSLAEQRAAVPGRPGEEPTKAVITISTCATPEDNAAGNYWRDGNNNPEHRIDKIGALVSTAQTPPDGTAPAP